MPKLKKTFKKTIDQARRSKLEYFSKAAAAIAGMSLIPTIATSAVSFKKGPSGASTLWLADDGNVGIGTTSPGEKLEVSGNVKLTNQILSPTSVTFDSTTTTGLRITNPNGYVSLTPLNTSWAHIYTDRANFIFNTPVYSVANAFSSYNNDLLLRRNGTTKITAGDTTVTIVDTLTVNGTGTSSFAGNITAAKVYGAVWNDIADYLETDNEVKVEFGKVYVRTKQGETRQSVKPCEKGIIGIASDTYGMSVGKKGKGKKEIPIALAGIVLAYCDKAYEPGTPLTASRNGKVTKMYWWEKLLFPERIVATYYKPERAKKWNGVVVNGRHWVKIA